MSLTKNELVLIKGGAGGLSGSLINSILRLASFVFELGRSVGSGIRYKVSGYTC